MTYHPDAETALAPLWPLFDWPSVRRHKCLTLYTLARRVPARQIAVSRRMECAPL